MAEFYQVVPSTPSRNGAFVGQANNDDKARFIVMIRLKNDDTLTTLHRCWALRGLLTFIFCLSYP